MKTFVRFSVLLLLLGTALVCFISFSKGGTSSSTPGMSLTWQKKESTMTVKSRKLQGNGYGQSNDEGDAAGDIHLEDYRPIDPVPSSKASIRPGPIQHGTPLMPYIPSKPSPPPSRVKHVGFP